MLLFPGATVVTTPPEETVEIPGIMLLHTPPGVTSVNVIVEPKQTCVGPVMIPELGTGLTVIR